MKKLLIITLAALLVLGLGVGTAWAWFALGTAFSGSDEFAGIGVVGGSDYYSVQTTAVAGHGFAFAMGSGDECGGGTRSFAFGRDFVGGTQLATISAGYEAGSLAQAEGAGSCAGCGGMASLNQNQHVWVNPCEREAGAYQHVDITGQGDAQTLMYTVIGDEYFDMGSSATGSTYYHARGDQSFEVYPCGITAGGDFDSRIEWRKILEYDD